MVYRFDFHPSGQMTDLLYTEKDLVTSLKDYIRAEENKLEQVKRWVTQINICVARMNEAKELSESLHPQIYSTEI